ncbi:alpha/beta hydrolase [Streptomyces sp. NPDC029041]|uniref:alpha/beta hydrolase n=1 Tax=Streptomyces sp. NPDC029041 TaxID=3155727 RepID=UPI0033E755F6
MRGIPAPGEPLPNSQATRYFEWTRQYRGDGIEPEQDDPRTARLLMRAEAKELAGPPEPVHAVEEIDIDHFTARLYHADDTSRDVLVWMHGGGWMAGDADVYDTAMRALVNRAGCSVLSVNYRLAPEHPYPAGLDDCWTALNWATARFDNVAVGGDSAGGNLAAATALRARDHDVALALHILIYPVLDYRPESPSYAAFAKRYRRFAGVVDFGRTTAELIQHIWESYVPEVGHRYQPYASPLRARSLRGVAPALVVLAEHDILRQEGFDYVARLESDGVQVAVSHYAGQVHGFFHLPGSFPDALDVIVCTAEALRAAFSAPTE